MEIIYILLLIAGAMSLVGYLWYRRFGKLFDSHIPSFKQSENNTQTGIKKVKILSSPLFKLAKKPLQKLSSKYYSDHISHLAQINLRLKELNSKK